MRNRTKYFDSYLVTLGYRPTFFGNIMISAKGCADDESLMQFEDTFVYGDRFSTELPLGIKRNKKKRIKREREDQVESVHERSYGLILAFEVAT